MRNRSGSEGVFIGCWFGHFVLRDRWSWVHGRRVRLLRRSFVLLLASYIRKKYPLCIFVRFHFGLAGRGQAYCLKK